MCKTVILLSAIVALLFGQALAQNTPLNCSDTSVQSINWNDTALFGNWLELARNPGTIDGCQEFQVALRSDNTTLSINSTHSSSPSSLYQNINDPEVTVNVADPYTGGYNVSFTANHPVLIKLLQLSSDKTYLVGCGYTNATNNATSFGFILGRGNLYNDTGLKAANDEASLKYSNFINSTYSVVLQKGCTRNSASQSLPLISGIVALALLLIKAH